MVVFAVSVVRVRSGREAGGHDEDRTGPAVCAPRRSGAWAKDAGYLADRVLFMLASAAEAAEAEGEDRLVLPAVTYHQAGHLLARLAAAPPENPTTTDGWLYLLTLPAWEMEALWEVLTALRRARDGEPGTEELRDLADHLGASFCDPERSLAGIGDDLRRVAAVLTLDTPAVTTLATAMALRAPLDGAARQAYRHITAAWRAGTGPGRQGPGRPAARRAAWVGAAPRAGPHRTGTSGATALRERCSAPPHASHQAPGFEVTGVVVPAADPVAGSGAAAVDRTSTSRFAARLVRDAAEGGRQVRPVPGGGRGPRRSPASVRPGTYLPAWRSSGRAAVSRRSARASPVRRVMPCPTTHPRPGGVRCRARGWSSVALRRSSLWRAGGGYADRVPAHGRWWVPSACGCVLSTPCAVRGRSGFRPWCRPAGSGLLRWVGALPSGGVRGCLTSGSVAWSFRDRRCRCRGGGRGGWWC
ncbi:hypothetical protein GCM10027168_73340 [Streptomyces capparidis]